MAKQKLNFSEIGKRASEAGHQLAAQDRQQEHAVGATRGEISIDQVLRRPGGDTRPVDALHALSLAESIAVIGLLEPVVLDRKNRLVAGAHRLAALRLLASDNRSDELATLAPVPGTQVSEVAARLRDLPSDPNPWRMIPVHRLDLDVDQDPAKALAAEVAENERRRDYTRSEIKSLAERLKAAGFKHTRGRPKAGERALVPALEVIVGKSRATLWRMLGDDQVIVSDETITSPKVLAMKKIEEALRLLSTQEAHATVVHTLREVLAHLKGESP
jgi:ParB family chromosome partitioning protein